MGCSSEALKDSARGTVFARDSSELESPTESRVFAHWKDIPEEFQSKLGLKIGLVLSG